MLSLFLHKADADSGNSVGKRVCKGTGRYQPAALWNLAIYKCFVANSSLGSHHRPVRGVCLILLWFQLYTWENQDLEEGCVPSKLELLPTLYGFSVAA